MLRGVNKLNQKAQNTEDLVKANIVGNRVQDSHGRNSMTQTFTKRNQRILHSSTVKLNNDLESKS